jgi:hypothetical protein
VTLSGTLLNTFANYPVAGQTINFGLGTQSCNGFTDVTGAASCGLIVNQAAGTYPLTAAFGGTAGSGPTAQSCVGVTNGAGQASCDILVAQPLGANTASASFAGDAFYAPSAESVNTILFEFLKTGSFAVGDLSASGNVTFWSADWAASNALTGGAAPPAFKGLASTLTAEPPACGITWTTAPGNSSKPPATIPSYMAVLVSNSVTKAGSDITGNVPQIVIVQTAAGYASNPGHSGTGVIVATLCQ